MCAIETPVQAAHRAASDLQHHLEVADVELREATRILRQFLEQITEPAAGIAGMVALANTILSATNFLDPRREIGRRRD